MEELLNKLIKKGWKPRGYKVDKECMFYRHSIGWYYGSKKGRDVKVDFTIRQLVSKESMLWQFCVENKMVDGVDRWTLNARQRSIYDKFITSEKEYRPYTDYQYWLIESSLVEEKDLAKFLLDNIRPGAQNQ